MKSNNAVYGRFALMIVVSTIVMYGLMYLNTFALDHIFFSQTRAWMALLMGAVMAGIMLTFMRGMYPDRRLNTGIYFGSVLVFAVSLWLVRSQDTVYDVSYMKAMIPHHSIAVMTSERAHIRDPRVRKLADGILEAQVREIGEMQSLIADLERNPTPPEDARLTAVNQAVTMREQIKRAVESVTGIARPTKNEIRVRDRTPDATRLEDDGETPNNPHFPLIHYKTPVSLAPQFDPAAIFEVLFAANGWKDSWRDGIYKFLHFHTRTHEGLGIARGNVKVQFGGRKGIVRVLDAGDVAILPAGTGHKRLSATKDLLVIGAYPQKSGGEYNEPKPEEIDCQKARAEIARVGIPARDPVYGIKGGLKQIWRPFK